MQGKVIIFKTLAIPKTIRLALVTNFPSEIINKLNKIREGFHSNVNNLKIKHTTLCNKYENGGLRKVDILSKVISLKWSWIKQYFITSLEGNTFLFN